MYRVVYPVVSDRRYAPGETIDPSPVDAAAWLELGIVAELEQQSEQTMKGADAPEDSGNSGDEPGKVGADPAATPEAAAGEPDIHPEHQALLDAIGNLTPGRGEHWTNAGKPECRALSGIVGWPVSAAVRDAAWERHIKLQNE